MAKKRRTRTYRIYDAFPKKSTAKKAASDLRAAGDTASVRKISPQDSGRLRYGVFTAGRRRKKK